MSLQPINLAQFCVPKEENTNKYDRFVQTREEKERKEENNDDGSGREWHGMRNGGGL